MLEMIGGFAGGVGLFLLGMSLMTQGLMQAAGPSLRRILQAATASPYRGLASGVGVTALVQSSSAVTVATIGFVNAGLMHLSQAIPVIFGSNIGTTMTGWLVATLGFHVKISVFALPMIGLGMALRITRAQHTAGKVGEALAGFGLFFVGVDILKDTFAHLEQATDLSRYAMEGIVGVLVYILVGIVLTTLLQSSSAAMAMTLTAASGGAVSLENAAALVIGANVGTTTTAVLTVIGASPAAKRLAGAHVLFNLLTAGIGLLLLPLMLWGIGMAQEALGMEQDLSVLLALFHTSFNVLGVLCLWSAIGWMTRLLEKHFIVPESETMQPMYLDRTLTEMPALALAAAGREIGRVAEQVRSLFLGVLSSEFGREPGFVQRVESVQSLVEAIGEYTRLIQRRSLQESHTDGLGRIMENLSLQHVLCESLLDYQPESAGEAADLEPALLEAWKEARQRLVRVVEAADPRFFDTAPGGIDARVSEFESHARALKARLLRAGAAEDLRIVTMVERIETLEDQRRLVGQLVRSLQALRELESALAPMGGVADAVAADGLARAAA